MELNGVKKCRTHSEDVHGQLRLKGPYAPVVDVDSGHSGRRFGHSKNAERYLVRMQTCQRASPAPHTRRPPPGLPLAEDGVVHQVGGAVGAAERVVHRLVTHGEGRVVRHDGVVEDVLWVFASDVLGETRADKSSQRGR